jgi:hypothetical protein
MIINKEKTKNLLGERKIKWIWLRIPTYTWKHAKEDLITFIDNEKKFLETWQEYVEFVKLPKDYLLEKNGNTRFYAKAQFLCKFFKENRPYTSEMYPKLRDKNPLISFWLKHVEHGGIMTVAKSKHNKVYLPKISIMEKLVKMYIKKPKSLNIESKK